MNLVRWLDRAIFALIVVVSLQVPVLCDQYRQYLVGYVDGLSSLVTRWQATANEFGFSNVDALIAHLQTNSDPVVVADAAQKQQTLAELQEKQRGVAILSQEHRIKQVAYILSPSNTKTLSAVLAQFKPNIPLSTADVALSIGFAIMLQCLLLMPMWLMTKATKRSQAGLNV